MVRYPPQESGVHASWDNSWDHARPRILDTDNIQCRKFFSNSVFLAEDVFFPFFSPLNPPLKPALFQRCSLSRVFDERVRNRALDRSAPLNALEPSRDSRRKKLFLKGK